MQCLKVEIGFFYIFFMLLTVLQRQNEQRCEQEIEEIEKGIQCGNIKSDSPCTRFSDEALDELKHCIQISDEKVALALTAYDVVNNLR